MSNTNPIGALVQGIIYDCGDPKALAEFYGKLLGGTVTADPYGGYGVTMPGTGINLGFQYDEFYKEPVWLGTEQDQQPIAHLDIQVADRKQAVEYALSIGAKMPAKQYCQPDWDVQWTTLFDPEGHPFCFFQQDHQ